MISLVPPPARSSVSSFGEGNVVAPLNPLANQLPIRVRKAYTPCQMSVHRTPVRQAHKVHIECDEVRRLKSELLPRIQRTI